MWKYSINLDKKFSTTIILSAEWEDIVKKAKEANENADKTLTMAQKLNTTMKDFWLGQNREKGESSSRNPWRIKRSKNYASIWAISIYGGYFCCRNC